MNNKNNSVKKVCKIVDTSDHNPKIKDRNKKKFETTPHVHCGKFPKYSNHYNGDCNYSSEF